MSRETLAMAVLVSGPALTALFWVGTGVAIYNVVS
jgi:anti-sigma B factor antagonist